MIETLAGLTLGSTNYDMLAGGQPSAFELRSLADAKPGNWLYDALTLGTPTYTGRSINPNTAMTYTAVYGCVKILSEAIASLDLLTYRNSGAENREKALAMSDYRFRMLREQPNREMTSFQWREQMMVSLLLWGNSYAYLDWNMSNGYLKAIWPLRADWMMVMRNDAGRLVYRYLPMYGWSVPVPPGTYEDWQILHIPGLGFDGTIGYSPITMARQAVALGLGAEEFAGRFYNNNSRPNVVLKSTAAVTNPEQLKNAWREAYGGLENTGKVAVLPPGLEIQTFSINPRDAQFLEGREWQLGEIARIFGVPLNMLADVLGKASTYASAEQFDIGFAKHTVRPWCKRIEQKLNNTVLGSQAAMTCKHDMRELLRGDAKTQAETLTAYVKGKIMKPNEAREELDLNPDDNPAANQLWGQLQDVPLGTPVQQPTQQEGAK